MSQKNLLDNEDKIITRMGKAFLSQRTVYRGKDLHHDLKDMSWIELYAFGITGRQYNSTELKVLNYIWVSTSYPDKAIWPNHVTALAASSRSTASLGLSIGMSVCEADIYGGVPFVTGIDFFLRAAKAQDDDTTLNDFITQELSHHKVIYGYGRPLTSTDERIPHVLHFLNENNYNKGRHLKLALETAKILNQKKGLNMNVAALYSALGADLGFTPDQFHLFMTPCFFAGMPPCYIEASENKEGTFLPIRCDRIEYQGVEKRVW
jgi:citrate synthase